MTTQLIILLAIVACVTISVIVIYNALVRARIKVREAYSTMDVYLKKRFDLIPSLVVVVKGYASHEAETLEKVTALRTQSKDLQGSLESESRITEKLAKVMAVVEAYPELKANKNFLDLQEQLVKLEDDIASARRYYNGSVREYNNLRQTFPTVLLANLCNMPTLPMFCAKSEERDAVNIEI